MNKIILMGRLTAEPVLKYSSKDTSMAIVRYTLAVDRRFAKKEDGNTKNVTCDRANKGNNKYELVCTSNSPVKAHLNGVSGETSGKSFLVSMKEGFDNMPLVYCIGPDLSSINAFWGINLHYFDKGAQLYIIDGMQKKYQMFSEDKRVLLGGAQLNDIYSNIGIGLRCYNRKNIMDCSRIKMQFVPKYLGLEGKFRITDQREVNATFDLAPGNKGF